MKRKVYLETDVLSAARDRIAKTFDSFDRVYVSFSGGKDSTVMLDLVATEARRRCRRFGLLFVDLEAQYRATIDFVAESFIRYADVSDPYWLALPLSLRNAVSAFEPKWMCWDPACRNRWVREPHPLSITSWNRLPWFVPGMEFEDMIVDFGHWYSEGKRTACLVGIRTDESLNRFRTLASRSKESLEGLSWTTRVSPSVYNVYPIYDWGVADVWHYHAVSGTPHNRIYDLMFAAGLTPHQMRICQPYGDDQRKGLWLYHIIEPASWARIVARVNGANGGALYSRARGNVNGVGKVELPEGYSSFESFAKHLLESMPPHAAEHYRNKIAVFVRWYETKGYPNGIPDTASVSDEANRKAPSWRRVCKTLLRNDWWCKGLGFCQHKSGAYDSYLVRMKKKRSEWKTL